MLITDEYRFEKISIKDGLPNTSVTCSIQDSRGFMWFGTFNGVSKYDGYKLYNYPLFPNALNPSDANVTVVFEDSNEKIWIGTVNGLILEYDILSDTFLKNKLNIPDRCFITSICEDKFGYLWVGTTEKGLFKFDPKTKTSNQINFSEGLDLSANPSINVLLIDRNDELLIGTSRNGLYIMNILNHSSYNIDLKTSDQISGTSVRNIHKFDEESYLILTASKLILFNHRLREFNDIILDTHDEIKTNSFFKSLYHDRKIWICPMEGGILEFVLNFKNSSLSGNVRNLFKSGKDRIISFYKDKSEVIWIGTMGAGLYKVNLLRKKFFYAGKLFDKNMDFNMVFDLKIDRENNFWIGSFKNGLYKSSLFSSETIQKNKIDLANNYLSNCLINVIYEDINGNIWIGTNSSGLFKYIKEKDCFENWASLKENGYTRISAICEYKKGSNHYLLIGTNKKGILCIDTITNLMQEFTDIYLTEPQIKNDSVAKLYCDSKNNLWLSLSNFNGVYKISLTEFKKKNFYTFGMGKILEDSNKNVWIGSTSGLIKHDSETELNTCFSEKHGISNKKIYGILEDRQGNIWVSTRETISKFDTAREVFRNYEFNDGPCNEEFWIGCCRDSNGTLYFGGLNGIDYFKPEQIVDNPFVPNVIITDFQLFNKSVIPSANNSFLSKSIEHTREINLTYKENIFTFEFAALIFNNPKQNQYAYMMEGFDKDWVYCGTNRKATYTNLDPGEYTFRVKGSNNDGVWNEEGTSIKITITPPFWKTWWFKGLGAMSLAAASGLTYKSRLDKINKEKKEQEEFSRKLIESQENERKRIASELHDTIAHEVLIAKNKADIGLKHSGEKERVENTLREISELSSATIKDIRNISYNLHPHQLERLGFTKTIKSIVNEVSSATDIDFCFESDMIDKHLSKESEINLFRVIQESINNMIKHSGANKAEVKLMVSEDYILVILRDNGKGINPDKKFPDETKGGFGLSGMKERIKYMKGEIHIESEANKGTSIIIRIPAKVK